MQEEGEWKASLINAWSRLQAGKVPLHLTGRLTSAPGEHGLRAAPRMSWFDTALMMQTRHRAAERWGRGGADASLLLLFLSVAR